MLLSTHWFGHNTTGSQGDEGSNAHLLINQYIMTNHCPSESNHKISKLKTIAHGHTDVEKYIDVEQWCMSSQYISLIKLQKYRTVNAKNGQCFVKLVAYLEAIYDKD